jgi:hypothetical protein
MEQWVGGQLRRQKIAVLHFKAKNSSLHRTAMKKPVHLGVPRLQEFGFAKIKRNAHQRGCYTSQEV